MQGPSEGFVWLVGAVVHKYADCIDSADDP